MYMNTCMYLRLFYTFLELFDSSYCKTFDNSDFLKKNILF